MSIATTGSRCFINAAIYYIYRGHPSPLHAATRFAGPHGESLVLRLALAMVGAGEPDPACLVGVVSSSGREV